MCVLNTLYIIVNIQKVLGRNYTLAPVPWRVLGRKSLLPLCSRHLCAPAKFLNEFHSRGVDGAQCLKSNWHEVVWSR